MLSRERAEAITKDITAAVSSARQLAMKGPVAIEVLDRKQIRAFAENSMYDHNTPEEIRMFGRIDSSLGVIPVGANIETIILDMLEDAVMGIYDPKTKRLLIGAHVTETMLPMVSGHELAHGLQDMHFELSQHQEPIRGQSDAESARTFLIEGDAQASYMAYNAGDEGLDAYPEAVLQALGDQVLTLSSALPHPILARSLQLPYADGAATVTRLARTRGWAAVDALYSDLPTTSEQMLHIDKLLAREPAVPVTARCEVVTGALPDFAIVWEDTLGEASLLTMLADVEKAAQARDAAEGWGGDRYLVLDRRHAPAVVPTILGMVAWDTESDARMFESAFARYLERAMPNTYILEQRGKQIVYATRVPDARTRATLKKIAWKSFGVGNGDACGVPPKSAGAPTSGTN